MKKIYEKAKKKKREKQNQRGERGRKPGGTRKGERVWKSLDCIVFFV